MIKLKIVIKPNSNYLLGRVNFSKKTEDDESTLSVRNISSRVLELSLNEPGNQILKFSNTGVRYWDDFWIDDISNQDIDPLIEELILNKSYNLESVNIFSLRRNLKKINLSACNSLLSLNLSNAPALEELILNRCTSLNEVHLGFNKNISHLSLNRCFLKEKTLENILSEYIPTQNINSLVDLRGNNIPWGNRRIASKVRMLLCNNIQVSWSNNPPEKIIPAEMYSNFLA